MRILSIETSCDETGLAIFSWHDSATTKLTLESHVLASQIDLHAQYGGVYPAMAKRAHAEKIVPLFQSVLKNAGLCTDHATILSEEIKNEIVELCSREEVMAKELFNLCETIQKPDIDCIAVTVGPGLEPALWVGVNFAKALSMLWDIPILPINHMEGHVVTALFDHTDEKTFVVREIEYPLLALLVSGGHTELVISDKADTYKKIGYTVDDAIGEAFDKVARMLGLPYPGGPKISALAKEFRASGAPQEFEFPRPMQHSDDYNFSYSGLKTAVLYELKKIAVQTDENKRSIAAAFEDAAIGVLVHKVVKAIIEYKPATFLIGGGVAGNEYLQSELTEKLSRFPEIRFLIPERVFTTDNAVMIGLAGYLHLTGNPVLYTGRDVHIGANGNLSLSN